MRIGLGLGLCDWRGGGTYTPPAPSVPVITSSSISGTAEDGETLTANRTVTGYPTPTITYQWQASGTNISGQTAQTIVLDATGMGLTDGEVISCEITATNTEGSDTDEPTIAFVVPAEVPGAISDLEATAISDTAILLVWTAASGATSHEYRVDGGSWTATGAADEQTVTGLTAETEYDFEVRGVNVTGNGPASNVATETTDAASTTPALTSSDTLDVTSGQIMAEPVTTNTSCYCYLEGQDALSFELIGTQPGASFTLRKLNDGTFDFDNPEDFDQDNIYDVTLLLIGLDDEEVPVPITVTVEALTLTVGNFTAQTGVAQSTLTESNVITVTALNVPSVTVTASGLEYQKNGGAWTSSAGTAALNDTFKARLTSSASYLTLASGTLTFNGNVDRDFDVTTLADPAAATFTEVASQPANQSLGFGASAATFSVTFPAGNPVVFVAPQSAGRTVTSVTVNAVSCGAPVVATSSGDQSTAFVCPTAVSAGTYNVVVTVSAAQDWFGIMCGVLNNTTSLTPVDTDFHNLLTGGATKTTGAMTIGAGQVGVAFCVHFGAAPRVADTGVLISTGIAAGYQGNVGTGNYGMISRNTTAGSWTPSFTAAAADNGTIVAAVWG